MANEFIARNGLISQKNSVITGSLTVTGSTNTIGNTTITGSLIHGQYISASGKFSHAEGVGFAVDSTQKVSLDRVSYLQMNTNYGGLYQSTIPASCSLSASVINGNVLYSISSFPATATYAYIASGSTAFAIKFSFYPPIIIISSSYNSARNQTTFFYDTSSVQPFYNYIDGTYPNLAAGTGSHTEGFSTKAQGNYSHAEGRETIAYGNYSHAEGYYTAVYNAYGHAEGRNTNAVAEASHAEGFFSNANGTSAHAEGFYTSATGGGSHTEGNSTNANGGYSHAEGGSTTTNGEYSHAEGIGTQTLGQGSHAEGYNTITSGSYSHAEGNSTITSTSYQHTQGQYNLPSTVKGAFILGNGLEAGARSNLIHAAKDDIEFSGSLHVKPNTTASVDLLSVNKEIPYFNGVITTGVDNTFYSNFISWGDNSGLNGNVYSIATKSDGTILVGGNFNYLNDDFRPYFLSLNADGTENTTFYSNFTAGGTSTGINSLPKSIVIQSNDQILLGGNFDDFNTNSRNYILRLNSDGTEDTTFYANLAPVGGFNTSISTIAEQSDGKILVGGNFSDFNGNYRGYLVRLNSDGTEDTVFYSNLTSGGFTTGFNTSINTIAIQSDGKILVGGNFYDFNSNVRNYLLRLNSDGTEDTTFYANLISGGDNTGLDSSVQSIAVQPDGKILVGGDFSHFNGEQHNYLLRLNSDGTEDISFNSNLIYNSNSFNGPIYSITIQPFDNKILIGGNFSAFKGNERNNLIRLNPNGTEDVNFYNDILGTGLSAPVRASIITSTGNTLLGGDFSTINGITNKSLTQLTGSIVTIQPVKENISINRTPNDNLINIQGRDDTYNIIDITDYNGNKIFTLDNTSSINISGSTSITGSLAVTGGITGSLFGTSSWAVSASWAPTPTTVATASYALTSSNVQGGASNYIPLWSTATSLSSSVLYQSASNIGIGTVTPSFNLDIQSTATGSLRLSGSAGSQITLVRSTGGLYGYVRYLGSTMDIGTFSADSLNLNTNNTTRVAIKENTGNVLIGTTVDTGYKLYVTGSGTSGSLNVNGTLYVTGSRVGIGKTAPNASLDVSGSVNISGSSFTMFNNVAAYSGFTLNSNTTSTMYVGAQSVYGQVKADASTSSVWFGATTAGVSTRLGYSGSAGGATYINFSTNGTNTGLHITHNGGSDLMTVTSAGNVGIGNATPNAKLDVNGNTIITGSLNVSGSITITSGSVIMPNRPAFRVVGTSSTNITATTTLSGSAASVDYNQGNYYNNTTGEFTAPIAGLYSVFMNVRCGSINASQQAILYKNNSIVQLMWEAAGNTGATHFGVSGIVNLAANDTLKVVVAVGSINFDANDNWGAAYIG